MVHIGMKEYYDGVFKNLSECDEILYEGANIPSISLFSNEYEKIAKKLELETQSNAFNYRGLRKKLIHADYNKESGKTAWKELSLQEKFIFAVLKPLLLRIQYRKVTRKLIAKSFMTSNEEIRLAYGPLPDEKGSAENLLMRSRENIVIDIIQKKLKSERHQDKLIGIMYGAGHMKFISSFLTVKNGFVPQNGKFIKVFDVV